MRTVVRYLKHKRICGMVDVQTYVCTHNKIVPLYMLVWGSFRLAPIIVAIFILCHYLVLMSFLIQNGAGAHLWQLLGNVPAHKDSLQVDPEILHS